jgi:sensor histidine kinase YesM
LIEFRVSRDNGDLNYRFIVNMHKYNIFKKFSSIFQSQLTPNVFIPLFILLTTIAVVNSLQAVYIAKGKATLDTFMNYWISKSIYCWYYLFLAVLIQQLSIRIHLTRNLFWKWLAVHSIALVGSISFHQLLSLWVDMLLWKGVIQVSYFDLLLKNISVWLDVAVYICFILGFYMMEYRRINQENKIKYSQLESQLLRSQLQELRSVIHPSFLFSTLHSIAELLDKSHNKDADRLLTRLSNILRTTVYENDCDEKPLEEELKYIHEYLFIENVRFPEGLNIHEEIEEEIASAMIPNNVLQPIIERYVERALDHRLLSYAIRLTGKKISQQLVLYVEEDGINKIEIENELQQDDILFKVIVDRLLYIYYDKQCIQIKHNASGGMMVQIQIPFREKGRVVKTPMELENPL